MSFRKAPTRVSATIGGKEIILETGRVATPVSYTHLTLPTKA